MRQTFLIGLTWVMLMTACQGPHTEVAGLKVEMQENPQGVSTLIPRFSWRIESTMNDLVQHSYQIEVAESEKALKNGQLIWSSGTVETSHYSSLMRGMNCYQARAITGG